MGAHIGCAILSFFLALLLFAGTLLVPVWRVTSDRSLYLTAGSELMDARMEALEQKIADVAEEYSFSPDTVKGFVTREVLLSQEEGMADWLIGVLHGKAVSQPTWDTTEVQEAIREDELFQAAVPSAMRKVVARDQAAYAISTAVNSAVLPIRAEVLQAGLQVVNKKVDLYKIIEELPLVFPAAGVAALILALIILLVMRKSLRFAFAHLGSALMAAALMLLAVALYVLALDVPGLCGQVSALFALQVTAILKQLAISAGIITLAWLVLGAVLMCVFQHCSRRHRT